MLREPIVRVVLRLGEIELHATRGVISDWHWHQPRPCDHHYEHQRGRTEQNRESPLWRIFCIRVSPGKKRIEPSDEKRQTVDSCNGGELHQRYICRGWIAEQVPRKTDFRQVSTEHLERNPKERRAE